jgi:hypothetical protein
MAAMDAVRPRSKPRATCAHCRRELYYSWEDTLYVHTEDHRFYCDTPPKPNERRFATPLECAAD